MNFSELFQSPNKLLWTFSISKPTSLNKPFFDGISLLMGQDVSPLVGKKVKDFFTSLKYIWASYLSILPLFKGIRFQCRRSLRIHSSAFFHCWVKSFTWEELSELFVVWTSHAKHDRKPNKGSRLFTTVALFIISLTLLLIYFVQQK